MTPEQPEPTQPRRNLPPMFAYLGMSIVEASATRAIVRMQVPAALFSPFGAVHGGAVATLIDTAMGIALARRLSDRDRTATHQLTINYVNLARDPELICSAEVVRVGRTAASLAAEVHTHTGVTVARALATFGISRDSNG